MGMNDHQPPKPVDSPEGEAKQDEAQTAGQQNRDPRRRLRELLAIPERDRSDAIWDEIISLEIHLAPGNRISGSQGDPGRRQDTGRRQEQGRQQGRRTDSGSDARQGKRFAKRPRRGPGAPTKG